MAGGHGAAEQRYLDERRVAEVCGRGRGRRFQRILKGEAKSLDEAVSIAPLKTNLSGEEATYFGLRAMQARSESSLGHALSGKSEKALLQFGELHTKSLCQYGIKGKGIFARKE